MNQKKNGQFIAEQRKLKKLTQEQLAEKMGVSINAVSKWERGLSFPDVSLFKALCEELDISMEEFINGEKDNSLEAKDRAIISTIKSRNKIKRNLLLVSICSIIIIISLIIGGSYLYKNKKVNIIEESENDSLAEYYQRNYQKAILGRNVDAMLKYRNDGKYPNYYGGVYISDDSYNLVLQIVKDKIPKENTKEYLYFNELLDFDESIKVEYVKYSYNELVKVNDKINEYFDNHKPLKDLNSWGIDIMANRVIVNFVKVDDKIKKEFKERIIDSDLIEFESAIDKVDISKICTNYPEIIGDNLTYSNNAKELISIEVSTTEYIPVLLTLYDDGTYQLFTAYRGCPLGKICDAMLTYTKSIKGTYNYDVNKIIENSTNADNFVFTDKNQPKYIISLGEKFIEEYDTLEFIVEKDKENKYLDELLDILNIDLTKCAKPEYSN